MANYEERVIHQAITEFFDVTDEPIGVCLGENLILIASPRFVPAQQDRERFRELLPERVRNFVIYWLA
jgi:hypothetical protein